MKKIIALLLTSLMLLGAIGVGAAESAPAYIDADAANMTGTVRFWTAFAGQFGTDAMIADFNALYPNINVEYTVYKNNSEGNMTVNTAMLAGEIDVLLGFHTYNTAARWENNMLLDLTDRLAADNLDLVKEWGTDVYTYNGRCYCFPSGGLSAFVAINMDMWNAAGLGELPLEWTWDQYLDACRAMTTEDVIGGSDFNQTEWWTYSVYQTLGKDALYNEEGLSNFDHPLFAQALNREIAAEQEGIWYPKAVYAADGTYARVMFLNGKIASTTESIVTRFLSDKENYPHDFLVGYAPYPVNDLSETNYLTGYLPQSFYCVAQNCQDADAAYAFAKFAATYGSKYLFKAGHASQWTGIQADEIINVVFGSREEAEKLVDVDSYIRSVLAFNAPSYRETNITAFARLAAIRDEYGMYALSGQMSVEEALKTAKEEADAAILEAQQQ